MKKIGLFLALAAPALQAAVITWGTATVAGTSDVSLSGTLIGALNVGGQNTTQTVNGVTFGADPGGAGAIPLGSATATFDYDNSINADFWASPDPGGDAAYNAALDSGRWSDGGSRTGTINLGGLSNGTLYQIQLWIADSRGCCNLREHTVDGVSSFNTVGNIITGTFTADATSQLITIIGVGVGNGGQDQGPQTNMLQLRSLIPEPSAILMLSALGSLAVARRRRA